MDKTNFFYPFANYSVHSFSNDNINMNFDLLKIKKPPNKKQMNGVPVFIENQQVANADTQQRVRNTTNDFISRVVQRNDDEHDMKTRNKRLPPLIVNKMNADVDWETLMEKILRNKEDAGLVAEIDEKNNNDEKEMDNNLVIIPIDNHKDDVVEQNNREDTDIPIVPPPRQDTRREVEEDNPNGNNLNGDNPNGNNLNGDNPNGNNLNGDNPTENNLNGDNPNENANNANGDNEPIKKLEPKRKIKIVEDDKEPNKP